MAPEPPPSSIALGEHATLDEVGGCAGAPELRITVRVPFELQSLAEAELDISATGLRLKGPKASSEEVLVRLPEGLALDPEAASARLSRRRRQLVVSAPKQAIGRRADTAGSPSAADGRIASGATDPSSAGATEQPQESRRCQKVPTELAEPQASTGEGSVTEHEGAGVLAPAGSTGGTAEPGPPSRKGGDGAAEEEEEDDDDLPPPLESSRCSAAAAAAGAAGAGGGEVEAEPRAAVLEPGSGGQGANSEANEAAEALMQQALIARERKRQEVDEERRKADLRGGGLKKGFLAQAKPERPRVGSGSTGSAARGNPSTEKQEAVPYIAGAGSTEEARRQSLAIPEVQDAVKNQLGHLKNDQSWLTPQLMCALQSRPDLLASMQNPRILEAIKVLQEDPREAQKRYASDAEVTRFLKDFSSLMATHFDVLSKESPKKAPSGGSGPAPAPSSGGSRSPPVPELLAPHVEAAFKDPEVQELLAQLRSGVAPEMHEICRQRPHLWQKLKVLLDAGLLNVQP